MPARKTGLGRGLDALFADNSIENAAETLTLPLNEIEPNRAQPRQSFREESLAELADSIARHGILQPLLVRPLPDGLYQLVAGERRWRAARLAGLSEVPVVIRELADADAMAISLIENLQREDLNPVEEALGFQSLMQKFSLTQDAAAALVGKSRPAVANALRLLKLPESVLELLRENQLSAGHARALIPLPDETAQRSAAQEVLDRGLSVRQTETLAKQMLKEKKRPGPQRREPFFEEVSLALTETLGRRVRVLTKGGGGTLTIDFLDQEDLRQIAEALQALED